MVSAGWPWLKTFFLNWSHEFTLLLALSLASYFFLRMRVTNIAIETQILVSSALYAVSINFGHPYVGIASAIVLQIALSTMLTSAKLKFDIDDLMLSMGLYFACRGLAPIICVTSGFQAAQVSLQFPGLGKGTAFLLLIITTVTGIGCVILFRSFRLAKIAAEEKSEIWDRVDNKKIMFISSSALAGVLTALSGFYLVEVGNSYGDHLTHNLGFLALAIASTSKRIGVLAIWALILAAFIALAVTLNVREFLPESMGGAEYDVLPFLIFLVVAVVRNFRWTRPSIPESKTRNAIVTASGLRA